MKHFIQRNSILFYIVLAFLFSWSCWSVLVFSADANAMQAGPSAGFLALAALGGIGPSVAGLITTAIAEGKVGMRSMMSRFTLKGVSAKWIAVALLVTPMVGVITILVEKLAGMQTATMSDMLATLPVSLIYPIFAAFGEEFGWRGFLLPKLQKRNTACVSSITLGVIWGLWHVPTQVLAFRQYGIWAIVANVLVTHILGVTAQTIAMTWLHNNTKNNLALMVLNHYSITFAAMFLFPLSMSVLTGLLHWFIYAAIYWLFALLLIMVAGPVNLVRKQESKNEPVSAM